ncbi:MAG TPA: AraC family transcriptional regulator [Thermoanaerobaculia bacterium]|nr:AraC family transcriptional regulator [Thermoanaerobaculia bacterium]
MSVYRIRDLFYEPGFTYAPHAHDEMQISVVLRGTYEEDARGLLHHASAADVVFKPGGTLHSDVFAGTRIICIDGVADGLDLGGYAWHRGGAVTAAAVRVVRRFLGNDEVDDALDELFAALAPRSFTDHVVAERAATIIEDTFADAVSLRSIANELRVHPVYLARVFRLRWGCTPREYLQRVRVRHAAHRVASSRESLADIALDSGFCDQAHMTRVFGRMTGVTPAAMRRLARV